MELCADVWFIILQFSGKVPRHARVCRLFYEFQTQIYVKSILDLSHKYRIYQYDIKILMNLLAYKGLWDDFLILYKNVIVDSLHDIKSYTQEVLLEYGKFDILGMICRGNPCKIESYDVRLYYMWYTKHPHRFKYARHSIHLGIKLRYIHSNMKKYLGQREQLYRTFTQLNKDSLNTGIIHGRDNHSLAQKLSLMNFQNIYNIISISNLWRILSLANILTPEIVQRCLELQQKNHDLRATPQESPLLYELIGIRYNTLPKDAFIVLDDRRRLYDLLLERRNSFLSRISGTTPAILRKNFQDYVAIVKNQEYVIPKEHIISCGFTYDMFDGRYVNICVLRHVESTDDPLDVWPNQSSYRAIARRGNMFGARERRFKVQTLTCTEFHPQYIKVESDLYKYLPTRSSDNTKEYLLL